MPSLPLNKISPKTTPIVSVRGIVSTSTDIVNSLQKIQRHILNSFCMGGGKSPRAQASLKIRQVPQNFVRCFR